MDPRRLQELLEKVRDGAVSPEEAATRLATLPYEDLGFAKVDHHRALRRGFPEAVFGAGKTHEQIAEIVATIAARGQNVLVTRPSADAQGGGGHPTGRGRDRRGGDGGRPAVRGGGPGRRAGGRRPHERGLRGRFPGP